MGCFRMASPWADRRTGMLYLYVKVAADLQKIASGRRVDLLVGDDTSEVRGGSGNLNRGAEW